jgi:hypothetical protein
MNKLFEKLRRPFPESSIEFVVTWTYGDDYNSAILGVAPYIKREAVIVRLDHVVGPESWKNEISPQAYGLYNGISIRNGDDWITKFDGSEMSADGGRIDAVKSVSTFSLRRSAELWGIGRYLKDIPELFAVKRPDNEYDAHEKSQVKPRNGKPFNVRWDHPMIPKEFLPKYMTPEQYYTLSRLTKYFSEDKMEKVNTMLDAWEKDEDSFTYMEAKKKIDTVRGFVEKNISYHDKYEVYVDRLPGHQAPKPKGKSEGKTKPDPKPKEQAKPKGVETKAPADKDNTSDAQSYIQTTKEQYSKKFIDLKKLLEALLEKDFHGTKLTKDNIQKDYSSVMKAIEEKAPLPEDMIDDLISEYSRVMVDLTDDDEDDTLPF